MLRNKLDGMDSELAAASAAVAARPSDPSALHHRAELYLARGRKQEALRDLRSAVALDGRSSAADSVGAQWRPVCRWLVWHAYAALVVLLGATVLISGLLTILSDLRGLAPTPLYSAADRGDLAKVTALLRARHPPGRAAVLGVPLGSQLLGQTPLSVAAKRDYPGVCVSTRACVCVTIFSTMDQSFPHATLVRARGEQRWCRHCLTPARSRTQERPKAHLAGSAQRRRCTRCAQAP